MVLSDNDLEPLRVLGSLKILDVLLNDPGNFFRIPLGINVQL
jgi:hypothetical protein